METDSESTRDRAASEPTLSKERVSFIDSRPSDSPENQVRGFIYFSERPGTRISVFYSAVILPLICFTCSGMDFHWGSFEPWQSGSLRVYFGLLFTWPIQVCLYPLVLFSMAGAAAWSFDPNAAAKKFWVQLGILAGVPLSFFLALFVFWGDPLTMGIAFIIGAFSFGVAWLICSLANVAKPVYVVATLLGLFLLVWLAGIVYVATQDDGPLFPSVLAPLIFPAIFGGAPMTFFAFVLLASNVIGRTKSFQFSIGKLLAATTYVAGILTTWKFAVDWILIEYAKLPVEDPNCFVSTAAATGHPKFVGSRIEKNSLEFDIRVNDQMRWLKAGELVIKKSIPKTHQAMRVIYNWLGPKLAHAVSRSKLLADFAFLALKPFELVVRLLFWLIGVETGLVKRIYRAKP